MTKLYLAASGAIVVLLLAALVPSKLLAANVTMSLSPSSTTVQSGTNFTVDVKLDLGANSTLDALARVNFDSSKVQYISASYSPSSSWGSPGPEAGSSSGSYRVDVVTNDSARTGSLTLARLTFKALVSSGSTEFNLTETSVSDGSAPPPTVHTVSVQGTNVSFSSPVVTDSGTPSTGSNNNQTPNNGSNSVAVVNPQPSEQEIQANSTIDDDQPVPVISFNDEQGYIVEVLIWDNNGDPIVGIDVVLGEQTVSTNDSGIAEFFAVKTGEYLVKVKDIEQNILILAGEPADAQRFTITVESSTTPWFRYIIIATLAVLLVMVVAYLTIRKRNNRFKNGSNYDQKLATSKAEERTAIEEYPNPDPPKVETVIEPQDKKES